MSKHWEIDGLCSVCVSRVYGAADANRPRVRGRANDAHSATRDRVLRYLRTESNYPPLP
jgi:hypothetical protein